MSRFFPMAAALFIATVVTTSAIAQNTQPQSGFGTTVAVSDGQILVGEPLNERIPGAVYVFGRDTDGGWNEIQHIQADDGHSADRFGVNVAVHGERLFVAATRSEDARGAVYVFERDADGLWAQAAKVVAPDAQPGDRFGAGLAAAGDRLFIGRTPFEGRGKVYSFSIDEGGVWSSDEEFEGTDEDGYSFGTTLAANDEFLMVAAPARANGIVYVYRQTDAGLEAAGHLEGRSADAYGKDDFGASIVLDERLALIAADNYDGNQGSVFTFALDESAGQWISGARLNSFDLGVNQLFGAAVARYGNHVFVGSIGADGFQGGVYVATFDADLGTWTSMEKLTRDLPAFTFFGGNVAAEGGVAVVSATNERFGAGTAYVFERDRLGNWAETASLASERQVTDPSVTDGLQKCEDGKAGQYSCSNVDLVSFVSNADLGVTDGNRTNDLWGWTDDETGREFAIVARTDGVSFVDITNPFQPVVLGHLPQTAGTPPTIWRDVKVYQHYAFVVADNAGEHGVQVFDMAELRDVENPPVIFAETTVYDRIHSAHNIVINEQTGFAYVVGAGDGGETCGGASHIIDLADPTNPVFAGCFAHLGTGLQGTGYTHDSQCVIYRGPDERYSGREICFSANENVISIADLTDKENPEILSKGTYPNPGYTHQGWLTEDQRFFFVGDETDEINGLTDGTRTLIWDVAELDDPILVNEHVTDVKASDHNLYIKDDYMYQSNYVSGLRVIDISDRENPVEVGYFDTVSWLPDRPGYGGSWSNYPFFKSGVIAVTSQDEGVFFLKRSDVEF